jgi:hypothetical protein
MPRTTDFLTKQRQQITARLEELRPLYEEYLTLEKAQQALDQLGEPVRRALGGNGRRSGRAGGTRRGPGRPRGSGRRPGRPSGSAATRTGTRRTSTRRRTTSRSRAGGTRAEQAFQAIKAKPGITIPELAERLKIRPNYLYRVTAGLEQDKRIRRRDGGFHAA